MRVRYAIYCEGRLLKVTDQVDVTEGIHPQRDGTAFVDGLYWWKIDEQVVADDVAKAMLDKYGERP